jgi:ATP-dependent helicase/nuclease subunit A
MNLKIISAGAGSGKTYTLTKMMAELLTESGKKVAQNEAPTVRASGILATTFTTKAATELKERVRIRLLEEGLTQQADELENALIGTVHGVGSQLLKRFAFEVGLSPNIDVLAPEDTQIIFNQSIATILDADTHKTMNDLAERLSFHKDELKPTDWQKILRELTDMARANNMNADTIEQSKQYSLRTFFEMLPAANNADSNWYNERMGSLLHHAILNLESSTNDKTKTKSDCIDALRELQNTWRKRNHELPWYEWAKASKITTSKKTEDDIADFLAFARSHTEHPQFHADIRTFIDMIFDLAQKAIEQYAQYKKQRGLIDYTDMETLMLQLLDNPTVCDVLRDELDLLLVDEFQDTNPMQLSIFVRLASLVKKAIWVGDPKQSIYGFRGAVPELMKAIIEGSGAEFSVLDNSWRSRQDLVNAVNGLFVPTFSDDMPPERIALRVPPQFLKALEPAELQCAVQHHNMLPEYDTDKTSGDWTVRALARCVADFWQEQPPVRKKGSNSSRPMKLRDIAVLTRTNQQCQDIAEALHKEGIAASIAQGGLLATSEALLIVACLKFVLNEYDTLAIAEILRFASQLPLEEIIADRFAYLKEVAEIQANDANSEESSSSERKNIPRWAKDDNNIKLLNDLRYQSRELAASEILQLLFEKLEIRRLLATWTNARQRIANAEAMQQYAQEYENSCKRLHSAATLGGFILWLQQLARNERDNQARDTETDAVQIMTYHAAKGLEWGAVFVNDLDAKVRDDIDGLRVVSQKQSISLDNPLDGRRICYWLNPYSNQSKGTILHEAMQAHPDRTKLRQQALAEEARLMYVGLTRACDYLIFPTYFKKNTSWLNRVLYKGDDSKKNISLPPDVPTLIWSWEGEFVPIKYKIVVCPSQAPAKTPPQYSIRHLKAYSGSTEYNSEQAATAREILPEIIVSTSNTQHFARPFALPDSEDYPLDYAQTAQLFAKFMTADLPTADPQSRLRSATNILNHHKINDNFISPQQLLQHSEAFYRQIYQQPIQYKQHRRNFRLVEQDQYYIDTLDLQIITTSGEQLFFIQPDLQNGNIQQMRQLAPEQAYRFYAAALALAPQSLQVTRFFVLFALEGQFVELLIQPQTAQNTTLSLF